MRVLTREEVREVDRRAIEEFGILGLVLMENAGRGVVEVMREVGISGPVEILCGRGNNAGDGFVIARHLDALGFRARVWLCSDSSSLTGDALANYQILEKARLPIERFSSNNQLGEALANADWIVDALLGTGAKGAPRPPLDEVIRIANSMSIEKMMAVDVPSGLDCETGGVGSIAFRASHTCTFVAAKPGLLIQDSQSMVGKLRVLGIGIPKVLLGD